MKKKAALSVITALAFALMPGLSGCGSDEDGGPTGPGQIGESDRGTASALAFGVVLPMIQAAFLGDYLDQISAGAVAPELTACQPLDFCSSGSGEFCDSPGALDLYFYDCGFNGVSLAGTLSVAFIDSTGGTASLGLSIDDFDITGTGTYTRYENCIDQSFEVSVNTVDANDTPLLINAAGYMTHCVPYLTHSSGGVAPQYAEFWFTIPSLDRSVTVSIYSLGEGVAPGDMEIVVQNLNLNQFYLVCHGNIFTGISSCGDGT